MQLDLYQITCLAASSDLLVNCAGDIATHFKMCWLMVRWVGRGLVWPCYCPLLYRVSDHADVVFMS